MAIAIGADIPFPADATTAIGCIGIKKAGVPLVACGKVPAPGSVRCPRCEVIAAYEANAPVRRAVKARRAAQAREEELAFLASSPLAAVNPEVKFSPAASERRSSRRPHAVRSLRAIADAEQKAKPAKPPRKRAVRP
jgi:hypothetical protein